MYSGFYTIASGMLTRQREIDVVGNNLINAQTPGYQADRLTISAFQQELLTRQEGSGRETLNNPRASTAAVVNEVRTISGPGTIQNTGRACDMALAGRGYFHVSGADGTEYLTRNGQFSLDAEGYLTLPGVGRVLGMSGFIHPQDSNFQVDKAGNIYNANKTFVGTLKISDVPDGTPIQKLDNGIFRVPGNAVAVYSGDVNVVSGSVELSNVDYNQEMASLMEAQRGFQTCSVALQVEDNLNRKATQIASV